jgi:hypothetical protein
MARSVLTILAVFCAGCGIYWLTETHVLPVNLGTFLIFAWLFFMKKVAFPSVEELSAEISRAGRQEGGQALREGGPPARPERTKGNKKDS